MMQLSYRSVSIPACVSRTDTLGVTVDAATSLDSVVTTVAGYLEMATPLLITFVNPYSRSVAQNEPQFRDQLKQFDVVLPDGIGMSMAIQWLHRIPAVRVSFDMTSLAREVFALAEQDGRRVVMVGGAPGLAERAAVQLHGMYRDLHIAGVFDGFGDLRTRAVEVLALNPEIVVCGMGSVRQEALLLELARFGWRGCGFTCGGFLDQLLERGFYYPKWVDRFELRWAYRLAREPRRLWRRYLFTYPPFFTSLAAAVIAARVGAVSVFGRAPLNQGDMAARGGAMTTRLKS